MNTKKMLLVAALLVSGYAQGCWNSAYTSVKNAFSLRDAQVAECKSSLNSDGKAAAAFDQAYTPWYYVASKVSFGLSGLSALVAGSAKYCPRFNNEKLVPVAAATALSSLISGVVFNRLSQNSLKKAKEAADSAE